MASIYLLMILKANSGQLTVSLCRTFGDKENSGIYISDHYMLWFFL